MTGDLHCHTRLSDGSMDVDDLVFYAKRMGLDYVAVTDHDTMAGIDRAVELGNQLGIGIIPGAEFSCFDYGRGRNVHLLCYYPQRPQRLMAIAAETCRNRNTAGLVMLDKVMELYPVTREHVLRYTVGDHGLYKSHIMQALMDLGYCTAIYGDVYKQLFSPSEGTCRVEFDYPDVFEVAGEIKKAGGICVMAHVGIYDSFDVCYDLGNRGLLDGLEKYYPRRREKNAERIQDIIDTFDLISTGGTDFHGFYASRTTPLGTCVTDEENLTRLFALKQSLSTEQE